MRGFSCILARSRKWFMGKQCVYPDLDKKINVPTAVTFGILHGLASTDVVYNSMCVSLCVCAYHPFTDKRIKHI